MTVDQFLTVGDIRKQLNAYPDTEQVCMTSRICQGTAITAINFVGRDKNGNIVITLDDSLLVKE
jgi:hypothetical protein